jgi:hypothetical protein
MTTIAQLEMLLSTLPSDVVSHIHDYAKHPVAEIFKVAESSGEIRERRFPTATRLIMECHDAFEKKDEKLFRRRKSAFDTWYNGGIRDTFTESDQRYFCTTNFYIVCLSADLSRFLHERFIYRLTPPISPAQP